MLHISKSKIINKELKKIKDLNNEINQKIKSIISYNFCNSNSINKVKMGRSCKSIL